MKKKNHLIPLICRSLVVSSDAWREGGAREPERMLTTMECAAGPRGWRPWCAPCPVARRSMNGRVGGRGECLEGAIGGGVSGCRR